MAEPSRVEVAFDLPTDEEGWPPLASESLWAVLLDPDHVRLDNAPWFVVDAAVGDVFRVRAEDGMLWATEKVSSSGNCTIRVIPIEDGQPGGDLQRVLDVFATLGVKGEGMAQYGIVALNVPPEADVVAVRRLLDDGAAVGSWDYDEGCITKAWVATDPV